MGGLVVYVAGGAMAGVYSAGVLEALARLNLRENVEAIYGISAGAFNAANFATGSATRSVLWYTEHAPKNHIIKSKNPFEVWIGNEVLDTTKATNVMRDEHLIDVDQLVACTTPVYFGVVDAETKEFVWKDARRPDALMLLRASASLVPFAKDPVELDGRTWIDGGYVESVALTSLRERHPGKRLIIILNTRFDEFSLNALAGYLVVRFHDAALAAVWNASIERGTRELAEAIAADDVILLRPDKDFPVDVVTTDTALVRRGFALGVEAVEKNKPEILKFIDGAVLNEV